MRFFGIKMAKEMFASYSIYLEIEIMNIEAKTNFLNLFRPRQMTLAVRITL